MRRLPDAIRAGSSERGSTLIELLVILAAGMTLSVVLFAVLDFTTRQTSRVLSRVDATQRARSTMETLTAELQAGCVSSSVPPIQPESNGSTLSFISGAGSAASVTPVKHTITFTPNTDRGTLTDSVYQPTGTGPSTGFSSVPSSTTTLLTKVSQSDTPVFQYFAFEHPTNGSVEYKDVGGNSYWMLLDGETPVPNGAMIGGTAAPPDTKPANGPSPLPLTAGELGANAARAVAVYIKFVAYPQAGSDLSADLANATFSDSVVMRLTPVANHTGVNVNVSPCA
jgi:hypothetical protein